MRCKALLPLCFVLALVLAIAQAASVGAGSLGDLHSDGGFVDARLGDSIESFTGLQLIGSDPEARTETYVRRSDDLTVGRTHIDGVTYSFFEGKLYFISVQMSGRRNAEAVLAALEETFGPGIETGSRPNERIWPGGKFFILYDLDPETQRGMAAMTSTAIHARMHPDDGAESSGIEETP